MLEMIVDSFAGGGGASTGIEMALGRSPDVAINHNPAALALHKANHPDTEHLDSNIWDVTPLSVTKGRPLGLLWASPDCKHFSKAKGGKPLDRNIRDLAWVVVRWAEEAKPRVILLENVEEFRTWGPLYDDGEAIAELRGQTFEDWVKRLKKCGYKVEWKELRACDFGAPTIRKRLFVVARRDGQKIVWPTPTHGAPDDPDVIAGKKLPWRGAAEIIDWSLPCPSIFDSSDEIMTKHRLRAIRPLAENTMARVARGMKRYVLDAERPFLVNLTHGGREEDLDKPINTITGAHRGEKALISPSISRFNSGATGSAIDEPLPTITANSFVKKPGGAAPLGLLAPHVMTMRNSGKPYQGADEPVHTITAGGAGLSLVAGAVSYAQQGGGNRDAEEPLHTICASGKDQNQVLVASLVGCGGRAGQSRPRGAEEPMQTITSKADGCVAAAFMAQQNNDSRRIGGVNPGRAAAEPLSTVTASGAQQGVVNAFISRQFGTSTGHSIDAPLGTITADGQGKSALIAPYMQKYYGTGDGSTLGEPCHTVTTKDRIGHVEATLQIPPFTEGQKGRARVVAAFMRAHGFWDEREFVTIDIGGVSLVIVDIGMRMLSPRELYNAQGFPEDYEIERGADGSVFPKSVQVSCVGNSVSPPLARALAAANCADMALERQAAE